MEWILLPCPYIDYLLVICWSYAVADDAVDDEGNDEDNYTALVAEEEKDFHELLDKDGDGRLNREEASEWVIPTDYDHSIEESRHLFGEADLDRVSCSLVLPIYYSPC